MTKKLLVFGLSGSGKTTFAKKLVKQLENSIDHYEADKVREAFNDWDFSKLGRERQNMRMLYLSNLSQLNNKSSICDYINPYEKNRNDYDIKIFMNTVNSSNYDDTDKIFEIPKKVDYEINSFDEELNLDIIKKIVNGL
jgi:tRNA uridine 5-carbamoylmethylation protein Kti12